MEDAFVVEQIVRGNREAFRLIVLRYERPLFRFLGLLGLPPAAAEDLAQQTFWRAYRSLAAFDARKAKFSTWLFTIAKRLAANEQQRAHRRHEAPATAATAERIESAPAPTTPADAALAAERIRRVRDALARLPEQLRSTFFLSQVEELTLEEVAELEGCPVGTVKSRIHRARERLRLALAGEET